MSNDPWADEPQAVAANAAPKYDYEPPTNSPAGEIVQTVKFGTSFDAPWLVAHGPDAATVNAIVNTTDYRDLVDTTVKVSRYAQKVYAGATAPAAAPNSPAPTNDTPRSQPDRTGHPQGAKEYCSHGEMQYSEWVSKAGKACKAFKCTERDRDQQCDIKWVK